MASDGREPTVRPPSKSQLGEEDVVLDRDDPDLLQRRPSASMTSCAGRGSAGAAGRRPAGRTRWRSPRAPRPRWAGSGRRPRSRSSTMGCWRASRPGRRPHRAPAPRHRTPASASATAAGRARRRRARGAAAGQAAAVDPRTRPARRAAHAQRDLAADLLGLRADSPPRWRRSGATTCSDESRPHARRRCGTSAGAAARCRSAASWPRRAAPPAPHRRTTGPPGAGDEARRTPRARRRSASSTPDSRRSSSRVSRRLAAWPSNRSAPGTLPAATTSGHARCRRRAAAAAPGRGPWPRGARG